MGKTPRWTLLFLELLHASVLGWAAAVLPWRSLTLVGVLTAAVAALHALTAALALAGAGLRARAWRVESFAALAYLGAMTWAFGSSAAYVARLYAGLGAGVAAALGALWCVLCLFTLPLACYGIAATGGLPRWTRTGRGAALILFLTGLGALGIARQAHQADAAAVPVPAGAELEASLTAALAGVRERPPAPAGAPSLWTMSPASCADEPAPSRPTILVTFLGIDGDRAAPRTRCVQAGSAAELFAALGRALSDDALRGPVKIDVVSGVQRVPPLPSFVDGFALRPGLDGVCRGARCLAPWQLVARGAYDAHAPLPAVPDLRFGAARADLDQALGGDSSDRERGSRLDSSPGADRLRGPALARDDLSGLLRLATESFLLDAAGVLHPLPRMHEPAPPLDASVLAAATDAAEAFVLDAQTPDGRFAYLVDPFTGSASFEGFSVARQAGTTLALCELGRSTRARAGAERSLRMLAGLEWRQGDMSALLYPPKQADRGATIGPTGLSMIAMLSCRPLVGRGNDPIIRRMGRFLLQMQRPDGGFHPKWDITAKAPSPGPDPLYASGQAVMALVLFEAMQAEPGATGPDAAEVRAAVDRAMAHFAGPYWSHAASSLFFLEENWHCLAARAALDHHRNDAYERFCLDYVTFKGRLVLDEASAVREDFVGGYGFGNVLPPHNTGTSGFGEALAAAMAVKAARGGDLAADQQKLGAALRFLVRQQWNETSCFACSRSRRIVGGMSEHMASPPIRIDYVQHAWAAMGHGARVLGLAPGGSG